MALTAAEIARRAHTLGGSEVGCVMSGDRKKIHNLWLEKTGEKSPENLSEVWPVQLGIVTEKLNLEWYERKQKQLISRRGTVITHPFWPWATVTLDGWIDAQECPIECKHVGGRERIEVIRDRYQPQMQWAMEITGANQCALSVIMGADEPVVDFVLRDAVYAEELIKRGAQFMEHVRNKTPPVDLPVIPLPEDMTKIYEMQGNNAWGDAAAHWLQTGPAAETHDELAKVLKSMVPPDAKKCFGHGVQIIRTRAGSLSLRELKE
jgi:predicted phage-related endonuclease